MSQLGTSIDGRLFFNDRYDNYYELAITDCATPKELFKANVITSFYLHEFSKGVRGFDNVDFKNVFEMSGLGRFIENVTKEEYDEYQEFWEKNYLIS